MKTAGNIKEPGISIRMYKKDKENFVKYAHELNMSASEFGYYLFREYEKKQKEKAEINGSLITLQMFSTTTTYLEGPNIYNDEPAKGTIKSSPVKKISFAGDLLYKPPFLFSCQLNNQLAEQLQKDFGLSFFPHEDNFVISGIALYYHAEQQAYLAHETIIVRADFSMPPSDWDQVSVYEEISYFEIQRCKLVRSYNEFLNYFIHYAHPSNLHAIRYHFSTDVEDNFDLLDSDFIPMDIPKILSAENNCVIH